MYKCLIGLIFVLWITAAASGKTREVSPPDTNPNCTGDVNCDKPWLIHVESDAENTTLHHLWGAVGALTFMTVVTRPETELIINWKEFNAAEEGSVGFKESTNVDYAFGFAVSNMILFNDVNDTGEIDDIPEDLRIYVPMTDFTWQIKEVFNDSVHKSGVVFETVEFQDKPLPEEVKMSVKILAYGDKGRSSDLPHLIISPDSAHFDITLDHLVLNVSQLSRSADDTTPIAGFSKPRWALDMVIFSMEHRKDIEDGFKYATHKSLDDEYTPGVFNIDDITTNRSRSTNKGGYVQWRPVSYLSPDRDINNSTFPHVDTTFAELEHLDGSINKSLAFAVFGEDLASVLVSTRTVVAFGQPKDKFYSGSNYTTWTLAYGVGYPPVEEFSDMIIIIISLGTGIPALVFIVGGIFVGCRRLRKN